MSADTRKLFVSRRRIPHRPLQRRGIHKRLAAEMLSAQRNNTELSVITIDLDDFKMLNDTYGHPTGDAVLRYTAAAIASVLRHSDAAAASAEMNCS
jgi:diguanylate cyclase (GGDEF)-like protein